MDFALIAQAATLNARVPFVHFFDGFRSSHEVMKIEELGSEDMHAMIDDELVIAHRNRALTPDKPVLRGTAQNPDVFFQARETVNPFYKDSPDIIQKTMDKFCELTGRQYRLFDYYGPEDAERIVMLSHPLKQSVCKDDITGFRNTFELLRYRMLYRVENTLIIDLKLPQETRTYVPKLLALKEIVLNPELYAVSLRCIPAAPGFRRRRRRSARS